MIDIERYFGLMQTAFFIFSRMLHFWPNFENTFEDGVIKKMMME